MSDIVLGARIEINTDGVTRGASTASAGIKNIGDAAKATQSQLASLNKQSQDTARSVTEGYKGLGAALGMGMPSKIDNLATGIQAYKKAVADAARAHAMLGSESAKANAGIASMASVAANARREIESLYAAGKSVAESYKGLGAALGMKTVTKVDNQSAWAELSNLGRKQLEAIEFANKMASSSTSLAIEKQKALEVQLAKNAEGWKKLGDMGKRQFDGSQMTKQMASATLSVETLASAYKKTDLLGQGFIGRMKLWFSETTLGQRMMAAETEKASKKMVAAHEKVGMSIRGWLPHIRTAGAAIGVYLGVRTIATIVRVADTFTEMGARLRLVSGNAQELARAQEGLFRIAQATRAPLTDVTTTYFRLGNAMRDLGVSQKDVLQTVETVGKAMRVSGASTIEISAAMQQLSQAFAKGKLDGDEFRSTMENAPRLMKALTDEFQISKGELYKWSETGRLSVEKLVQAIKNQSGAIEQEFKTIPVTISGAWQQVTNAMANYIGNADKAEGASVSLARALSDLSRNIDPILDFFTGIAKVEIGGLNVLVESVKDLGTALQALTNTSFLDKLKFLLAPDIAAWQVISKAFDNIPADAETQKLMMMGQGKVPVSQMAIGQPVGTNTDFFNGINKVEQDYIRAAMAAWKLTDAQKEVVKTIVRIGQSQGFDPAFLLSIAKAETRLGELNKVSSAGAKGIFQFMDGTARRFGVKDPWNLEQATKGASKYLSQLKAEFKTVGLAAAGYNAGEGNVRKYGGVPPFKETQTYVKRVLQNYRDLQKAMGASTDDMSKELQKAEEDQLRSYIDHLNARQSAFDNDAKIALAKQKTQMERMDAAQQDYDQQAKMAVASGDMSAIRQAEDAQLQFLQERKRLILDSLEIEKQATTKRIGLINMEIAKAQGTQGAGDIVAKKKQEREAERAELAQLAERRKQIEIQTQTDITRIQQQFEDDRRKAFRQNADDAIAVEKDRVEGLQAVQDQQKQQAGDFVEMQRQRIEGLQAEFAVQKELANISSEAFSQYADQQRGAIDLSLERAKAEFENRDAQRQAMLEGKEGLDAIIQARENLNARLQDQLTLLAQERDATVQKLDLTRQELEYQKRLAEWQLQRTQAIEPNDLMAQLQAKKQIADIEAQIAQNIQAQAKANETLAKEQAKAQGDAMRQGQRLDTQEVKENQLRMNAFWDQYMSRLRDYAALWQEITGQSEMGWSRMAVAAGEYAKSVDQIAAYWDKSESQKEWGGLSDTVEALQQGQAAAAMMAKTMMAARETVEKGSSAYDNLTTSAENFMQILQLLNVAEGIAAILKQLKDGDPYTAAIRAAGVAMMVASMGINTGFGGGGTGGGMSNSEARKANQIGGSRDAGGGVFGDSSAQSESISKALDLVAQNSSADLAYSAGMLRSLRNIELSLAGTTNAIIRGVGPQAVKLGGTTPFGMNLESSMMRVIDPIGSLLGLSKITKKITDWGIKSLPQSLDQVIAQGFHGMNWTEVTKTVKILGMTVSKSVKNLYSALDVGVAGQITRVIVGMADAVREAGKAFGISAEEFNKGMANFSVNFGAMSTKGLKGEELEKAVQQVFSSMSDDMAQAFQSRFDLGLEPFMRAGQGMFETLVMVSNGINTATGILAQFGLEAINYKDIIQKQGDVAAEIVRQSIVMFEGVSSAIGAYVDQAVGSAEELMAVYQDLLIISDTAKIAGFNLNDLSNALIVTSGGVNKFLENLSTYTTEILGGSDYARQMLTLTREFQKLGQAVPANNEAFVMLVDSIDTTTEAGQKLYAQILALAGAFSKAQQEAKRLEELRNKYLPADSMAGYRQQIEQVKKDFKEIIDSTLATLPGGPTYIRRTRRVEVLGNRRDDRTDDRDLIQAEISELEAKGKLTQKEKQRLATLRQQRKVLNEEIKAIDDQIKAIEKLIANNPKSKALLEERAKLLEEQGDAIIKTLSDIWDAMTQAITAARETLKSINDSIFELIGGTGSENMKLGMATARRVIAEGDYTRYTQNGGTDIVQLQKYADAYYRAIMDERDAKIAAIEAPMKALEKERDIRQKAHDAEIAALEKQLGVAKELFEAVKGIQEYAKSLRTSAAANLSPRRQLEAAKAAYDELRAKAAAGDVEAMRKITGASDTYLDAAKKYFGTGGKYGAIFDGIVADMDKLGMRDMGDAQSIQDKIDQLNEDHGKYLDSIDKQIDALDIEGQIKAENDKTAQRLKDLAKDLGPRIEQAEAQAKKDMADLIAEVGKTNGWSEKQLAALNQMLTAWGMDPIAGPAPANPNEPTLPAPTDDWVQGIYDKWIKDQTGYKPPLPAFAAGGLAQPGWALVGEEGPELVRFGSHAQVFDADYTARMMRQIDSFQPIPSQGGRPINLEKMPRIIDDIRRPDRNPARFSGDKDDVIAELRAMRTELKALVTTQSRANPAVIEQLANIERRLGYMERDAKLKPA